MGYVTGTVEGRMIDRSEVPVHQPERPTAPTTVEQERDAARAARTDAERARDRAEHSRDLAEDASGAARSELAAAQEDVAFSASSCEARGTTSPASPRPS